MPEPALFRDHRQRLAVQLKALGHPVRLEIVHRLEVCGCCCCGELCAQLPLAQSTISQHLEVLREAGIVQFERDGTRSRYALDRAAIAGLREQLAPYCGPDVPAGKTS